MRIKLGHPMSLGSIAEATGGTIKTDKNILINAVTTDSRELQNSDLFIAVKGMNFDGINFVSEVKKRGGFVLSSSPQFSDIFHSDSGAALLSFASFYIKTLPYLLYKIGITGSVGKTTTKEFLKFLLSNHFVTHASSGNFNNKIGMPMSVLSADYNTQILIGEMGMNKPFEIAALSKAMMPDIALITNVGTAHIGNLGSRENIAKAKLEITEGMNDGILIIPDDEPLLRCDKRQVKFSFTDKKADYFLDSDTDDNIFIYKEGQLYSHAKIQIKGEPNKKCLLQAASVAIELGLSGEELSKRMSSIPDVITRQNEFFLENRYFYTDYYNASRESVLAFIKTARYIDFKGEKNLLIGDILELGNLSETIHLEIGRAISSSIFSNLFLFGKQVESVRRGAIENGFDSNRIFVNSDPSNPLSSVIQIRQFTKCGSMIFMKGSRAMQLERILDFFKKNLEG